jgi:ABC-type antimicrobial peptide transport system permease subunit
MSVSTEPPEIKSFEALGVLLWSMNSRLADLEKTAANGATHADVAGLRAEVSGLMKRQGDIERELASAKEEWQRSKPATLFRNIVVVLSGIAVIAAFVGGTVTVLDALTEWKKAIATLKAKP